MQGAGNDKPTSFDRVGDAARIRRDRAQVAEGFPSLWLGTKSALPRSSRRHFKPVIYRPKICRCRLTVLRGRSEIRKVNWLYAVLAGFAGVARIVLNREAIQAPMFI